jgi:hypothetical protein
MYKRPQVLSWLTAGAPQRCRRLLGDGLNGRLRAEGREARSPEVGDTNKYHAELPTRSPSRELSPRLGQGEVQANLTQSARPGPARRLARPPRSSCAIRRLCTTYNVQRATPPARPLNVVACATELSLRVSFGRKASTMLRCLSHVVCHSTGAEQ